MQWISLALALGGVAAALIAGFAFQSVQGVVVGVVIALVGLWFRPRG